MGESSTGNLGITNAAAPYHEEVQQEPDFFELEVDNDTALQLDEAVQMHDQAMKELDTQMELNKMTHQENIKQMEMLLKMREMDLKELKIKAKGKKSKSKKKQAT